VSTVQYIHIDENNVDGSSELTPVSVIVPAFNEEDRIASCLESILQSHYANLEIIVVDDNSTDRTVELASRYPVKVIRRPSRGEKCVARNDGIKAAQAEIVAFVDADCTVNSDWLTILISNFTDKRIAGVGGIVLTHSSGLIAKYRSFIQRETYCDSNEPVETHCLPGGNSCYRTEILRDVGGFDPAFFRHEYLELGLRLRRKGFLLVGDPRAIVWHGHEDRLSRWLKGDYASGLSALSFLNFHKTHGLMATQLRQIAFIGFLILVPVATAGILPSLTVVYVAAVGFLFEFVRAGYRVVEAVVHYKNPSYLVMLPIELMLRAALYAGYAVGLLTVAARCTVWLGQRLLSPMKGKDKMNHNTPVPLQHQN
jgi:glycosyltransferase involved in cell wall biosynthesis